MGLKGHEAVYSESLKFQNGPSERVLTVYDDLFDFKIPLALRNWGLFHLIIKCNAQPILIENNRILANLTKFLHLA